MQHYEVTTCTPHVCLVKSYFFPCIDHLIFNLYPYSGAYFSGTLKLTLQILQSYDWLRLCQDYECYIQLGGSDQMGNIVSGQVKNFF